MKDPRGKKSFVVPNKQITVNIPSPLYDRIMRHCADPIKKRSKYGELSKLVTLALKSYLDDK